MSLSLLLALLDMERPEYTDKVTKHNALPKLEADKRHALLMSALYDVLHRGRYYTDPEQPFESETVEIQIPASTMSGMIGSMLAAIVKLQKSGYDFIHLEPADQERLTRVIDQFKDEIRGLVEQYSTVLDFDLPESRP